MFRETNDESILLKFWQDEQNYPRWYRDCNNAWTRTWREHLEFCRDCCGIYSDGNALVFVERTGNVHLSIMRGQSIDFTGLCALRDDLLRQFQSLFGWANGRNSGLKAVLNKIGMYDSGIKMYKGSSHGQVLTWRLYIKNRESLLLSE